MTNTDNAPANTMPLVELHCHIEGTVSPVLAQRLAARHGVDISPVIDADGQYTWDTFDSFLKVYDAMSLAVQTPEDYFDITLAYFREAASHGLVYGEMFISPAHAAVHGISYPTFLEAISAAMNQVEEECGVVGRLILTCVRHYGLEEAARVAHLAQAHPHPRVVGFGMAGDETFGAPKDFARVFDIAKDAGLHLTAHAGEFMGPASIRGILDDLGVARIGHGVRACEDPALVAELAARGVALELCPSSNISMNVVASMADHPIRSYLDAGLCVTISTDDPPFFKTDIAAEYAQVAAIHALDPAEMLAISRNAMGAAFCDETTKRRILQEMDGWARAAGCSGA